MEARYRRGPSAAMGFALFCFFLPLLTVSCPAGSATFRGVEIATGSAVKKAAFGKYIPRELPGERLVPSVLALTALGALVGLIPGRVAKIATGAIAALSLVLLLVLKSKVEREAAFESGGLVDVTWRSGYWLALASYVAALAFVFLGIRGADPKEPELSP